MEFRNFSLQVGLFKRYGQSLTRSGSNYDETIPKQVFGDVISKRGILLELTKRASNIQLVQTTVFKPSNIKAKVTGGVKATKNKVYFSSKSILKLMFAGQTNIAMYLGLKYSFDGISFLIGMKIGAIKMIFPILVMTPE